MTRWLYHLVEEKDDVGDPYAPYSLGDEGFIHCSFLSDVAESARLYFPPSAKLRVLQIDPRLLEARIEVVDTPRGPMPHVHGAIPRRAVVKVLSLADLGAASDEIG
jgi:uncharacterized protein (DUF952 family)